MLTLDQQNDLLRKISDDLGRLVLSQLLGVRLQEKRQPTEATGVLAAVQELRQDLWDQDTSLVDPLWAGQFRTRLDYLFAALAADGRPEHVERDVVNQLIEYAPDEVVARVQRAAATEDRVEALRAWWSAQSQDFRPFDKLDRQLDGDRKWRRTTAALALRDFGGPDLIDSMTGDVDRAAVARWRRQRRGPLKGLK